jgi:hypothetical protein
VLVGSLLFIACSGDGESDRPDDETGGTGGTGATGGATPTGGASGNAGSGTTGGSGGAGASGGAAGSNTCPTCMIPAEGCITQAPPDATINDFEDLFIQAATPTFGIYGIPLDAAGMPMMGDTWWLRYFSGSFAYPGVPDACTGMPTPANIITREDASGELHVTGTVGTYSGFGIWLGQCIIDMSAYSGVSFTIGGTAGAGMLKFSVHTSANREPDPCLPGKGTCNVATAGACTPASVNIPLPSSPETVQVAWTELTGGSPEANVDPSKVLQLQWDFEWVDGMTTPYTVDVTVDDVVLTP